MNFDVCSVSKVCNCYSILSIRRSHMLQADSEEMYLAWVTAMQQAIGAAIQRGMSTSSNAQVLQLQNRDSKGPVRPPPKPKSRYRKFRMFFFAETLRNVSYQKQNDSLDIFQSLSALN